MLKFDDKEYRNLQEQVLKNMQDIEALKKKAELADLGINIVTPEPFASASQLPLPYAGGYGDGFLVGTEAPYTLYIWTRESNEYNGEWFKWGLLNAPSVIPGPIGPQGIQGETGQRGSQWNSQTGNPTNIVGQLNYDQALNTQTGDVFQFVNGVWQKTGNIRGPQGIQGIAGAQGPIGPQGAQGEQGPTGPQGQFIEIVGTLENTGQLPAPTTVPRSTAYLVTVDGAEHIYLIIGEGTTESPLVWHDAGAFGAGSGTKVLIGGVQQEQVNIDTLTPFPNYLHADGTKPVLLSNTGAEFKMIANGKSLDGVAQNTNFSLKLPITNTDEIVRSITYPTDTTRGVGFILSNTYKQSLNQKIQNASLQSVIITAPSTATNGQLSEEDFTKLNGSVNYYILFNSEIYLSQDRQHDLGFLTYTHVGYDNTVNDYVIKCITITVSTRGWVLTSAKVVPQRPEGTTNALVGFDSINNLQYFNIGDGLSVEGNTLKADIKTITKIFEILPSDIDIANSKLTQNCLENFKIFWNDINFNNIISSSYTHILMEGFNKFEVPMGVLTDTNGNLLELSIRWTSYNYITTESISSIEAIWDMQTGEVYSNSQEIMSQVLAASGKLLLTFILKQ